MRGEENERDMVGKAIKEIFLEPILTGVSFGIVYLGTFYFLKHQLESS